MHVVQAFTNTARQRRGSLVADNRQRTLCITMYLSKLKVAVMLGSTIYAQCILLHGVCVVCLCLHCYSASSTAVACALSVVGVAH